MLQVLLRRSLAQIARIGADPSDSPQLRLEKALLLLVSLLTLAAGVVWSLMYLALGQSRAAVIPGAYALISALSIAVFAAVHHYAFLRFTQLLLLLILPFMLQVVLGG